MRYKAYRTVLGLLRTLCASSLRSNSVRSVARGLQYLDSVVRVVSSTTHCMGGGEF